jgi:archaea-specific RecJ-like exonuclease
MFNSFQEVIKMSYESNNKSKDSNINKKVVKNNKDFKSPVFRKSDKKFLIKDLKDNDFFEGDVKILRKSVPGPVIFLVSDGTGSVDAVTKSSDFFEDDVVFLKGKVSERAGKLQVEISTILKSDVNFDSVLEKHSVPVRTTFSIGSERFELMKPRFLEIAKRVRLAILSNQPILIRHHNDSDGINSGLALEQAMSWFYESRRY